MYKAFEYQILVKNGRELTKNVNSYLKDGFKLVSMINNERARLINKDGSESVIFKVEL